MPSSYIFFSLFMIAYHLYFIRFVYSCLSKMSIQKFRDAIENHTIFHQLEWIDVGDSVSDKPEQLMHIHDGSLYVWDNQNSCLNVAGLAKAQDHEDDDIQVNTNN